MTGSGSALNLPFFCDTHVHTSLCGHAEGKMEEYVQAAVQKGLQHIIFLEHMEEGIVTPHPSWLSEKDFDFYFSEGLRLKNKYRNLIRIGLGVECGYNPDCKKRLQSRLSARNWDQIGISCHFLKIKDEEQHLNLLSRRPEHIERALRLGPEKLFSMYLETLHEAISVLSGSLLCHLDAALRWVPGHHLNDQHYLKIDEILRTAATKNMILEINTSGIKIRGEPFPDTRIRSLAQAHGLSFQLGSDAHRPEDVGNGFERFTEPPF
ncbi:histidinol-phosphatase HisJ family protein [Desulforhopalus sp. IMCC35007]|uniref:histidinol-phosphatase HisJ family protein n=1 Tax=Desulforhopalus sp. IMCC35007 TaxID=2569543 RepID=UPI0010ADA664|nr:histidinol-phosphatase HisJ family protein [Desulforhopalus sp. IMCC35007]TKB06263.1 histidinol-phosphatase HisJ family protein [Desulforhopalus sp. IMCC35007]